MATIQETNDAGLFGGRLGRHLEMVSRKVLHVSRKDRLSLAVTRLTCERQDRDRTASIAPESAFSITYKLKDVEEHEFWSDGRMRYSRGFGAGTVNAIDLSEDPRSRVRGAFDTLQFYIRKDALDDLAYERGASPVSSLRSLPDATDATLGAMSSFLLSTPDLLETNQLFVDHIALSLLTYFAQNYGGMRVAPTSSGGLASWQERRAKEIMHSRLSAHVTISDIARECRLTPSYFAKAFRRTTGMSPHQYLTQLRIQEAKGLLLSSTLPLADIALICGFGDQSYFTRVFTRSVGSSPGAWRRSMIS
ncbi:helix-turn-helix transcriptional regulator [Microvirga lotononidis]|uniref:DNA-binding domain-containing protein, AraC-type n=1 Tax=Microvirga lotononidis TaxID=864069 RepID=I4YPV1_9HYPH|nr:AraC family transcriptional regulator [Microvirga lotononidis]EIM25993.1 DNA-binding domain-containing protein, AraC-type [Microvirga lotononidis]WQO25902.1 AraC family transcriptional regulator [Microvirga lotononidis]